MSDGAIREHYGREDLGAEILRALAGAGKDVDALAPEDLAPNEEFHIGGRAATLELAGAVPLADSTRVLDLGCGIGGPARTLASTFGCPVTGVDLTEEYVEAGNLLTERVGLAGRVELRAGSALDLPFEDGSFDVVWSQHVIMNIEDKDALYQEIARVLAPGGRYAFHEIFAGRDALAHFPVPWTPDPGINFLVTPKAARTRLEAIGFRVETWKEKTRAAKEWFRGASERIAREGPPPLGLATLVGPDFSVKAKNLLRNLDEERVRVCQAVLAR